MPVSKRDRLNICLAGLRLATSVALDVHAQSVDPAQLNGLQWRLLGPFRGGWGTMAAGIPDQLDTFYSGAAGGGIWNTTDAGATWQSKSNGLDDAAIGAIAISDSDPKVIYAGSGHPEPRNDIQSGNGLYKSVDGGEHWQYAGLRETRHIGAILIGRNNPDVVLVGALGHWFGPNPERGVFRSTDGGKSWKNTLYVDEQSGVVDLAIDPARPNKVYAASRTARNWPWLSYFTPIEGEGSAIWHSSDSDQTWRRLGGEGWPSGKLGRIGLGVTHLDNDATRNRRRRRGPGADCGAGSRAGRLPDAPRSFARCLEATTRNRSGFAQRPACRQRSKAHRSAECAGDRIGWRGRIEGSSLSARVHAIALNLRHDFHPQGHTP